MEKYNNKWNYDYSQTLWMKMFLSEPDFPNNRSNVFITFEQALEIIKTVDAVTQGITKIVYLVGWQGLGHDDCYPEMEIVNDALKRSCDKTASDSLWWLFEEAKKYNTVVSFHGNVADAYTATPCFPELAAANAVVNDKNGNPIHIEIFNGRDGYKTSYKQFWDSGFFKRIFDRFCEVTPVREAGTVHLDNFCIAQNMNPYTSVEEEDEGRNNMLDYIQSLGIDVTSEYTYRELELRAESPEHPIRNYYAAFNDNMTEGDWREAPLRTLGRIPATWWTSNITAQDCIDIPPSLYSGRLTDKGLLDVFYGCVHGEDIWMKLGWEPSVWAGEFIEQFCTMQLPYFYLNRYKRLGIEPKGDGYIATFSGGITSDGTTGTITKDGKVLKCGMDVLLPLESDCKRFIAYSKDGKSGEWDIPDAPFKEAGVYEITREGNRFIANTEVKDGKITLSIEPSQALLVEGISF